MANLTLNRDVTINNSEGQYILKPYDQVYVRTVPEFEMQQNVSIAGAVKFPGTYALIKENETLVDLLRRAGGPTDESFLEGATLLRSEDNIGYIVFEMPEALRKPTGTDNLVLKKGDLLSIPKVMDFVRVEGAIDAKELYDDKLIGPNSRINVAFIPDKNAKYYVDEFAAGVANEGDRGRITILRPNGRILKTKNYLLFKVYPKVEKGAIVRVGIKDTKTRRKRVDVETGSDGIVRNVPKKRIDWARTVADLMAQATAVISLVLLTKTTLSIK
jgi:hypothetical protein